MLAKGALEDGNYDRSVKTVLPKPVCKGASVETDCRGDWPMRNDTLQKIASGGCTTRTPLASNHRKE